MNMSALRKPRSRIDRLNPPAVLTARGVERAAGAVILTGSVTAAVPVAAGDSVNATFDRRGSVTAVFA